MDDEMNEKELKDMIIKEFVDLQRVKIAEDRDAEIAYQENVLKGQNAVFGYRNGKFGVETVLGYW